MASAGRVQGALRLIDILLPSFALFSLSRLLLCAFALSARLFLLECERGLAILRLVDLLRVLLWLAARSFSRGLLRSAVDGEIAGQFGVFLEWAIRTHRTLEHDARLRRGGRHDVRILALLGRALVEEIAVGSPGFESSLHRGRRYRLVEESQRSFVGL